MEKKLHDTFFVQIERTALEKPFIPSHSDGMGFLAKIQIKVRLNNFLAPLGDLESLLDCLVQHAYDMGLHISGRILEASVCGAYYLTDEGTIHLPLEKRWKMEATDEEILEVARKRELIC